MSEQQTTRHDRRSFASYEPDYILARIFGWLIFLGSFAYITILVGKYFRAVNNESLIEKSAALATLPWPIVGIALGLLILIARDIAINSWHISHNIQTGDNAQNS